MKDSQQPKIISYGSRGNMGRYDLEKPPPAGKISYNPGQVGKSYGLVTIISAERRYNAKWQRPYVIAQCRNCARIRWVYLANLMQGKSKGCQHCSQPRQIPLWLDRRLTA